MIPASIIQLSCAAIESEDDDPRKRITAFAIKEVAPLIPNGARIITIDGFDGVGKSALGCGLAAALQLQLVGLDEFLEADRGFYFDALRFPEMARAIELALSNHGKVIVEGCEVGAVLERIGLTASFKIYVMQTTHVFPGGEGERIREFDVLYGGNSTDQLIAEREELARHSATLPEEFGGGGSGQISGLERELILYHRRTSPHDHANIIVKVVGKS